ncbi:hypothetical protein KC867_03660 [Candidatus Saccharibacteria bacterium]|nr:hypothetical protein [Candidatus Saccharibacteria bacterium]
MHNNDIYEIYKILQRLENKLDISEEERKLATNTLSQVVAWAQQVAAKIGVPLTIANTN